MLKTHLFIATIAFGLLTLSYACTPYETEFDESHSDALGGQTTVYLSSSQAYSMPASNLSGAALAQHLRGDQGFEAIFVSSPAPKHAGLGPVFNNNSCISCHPADGRAAPPEHINDISGLFLKISLQGQTENGAPLDVPGYGTQLQHQALYAYQPEAQLAVRYEAIPMSFDDGTVITLQKPVYSIVNPYRSMPDGVLLSPRIGMPIIGLGLLEAITEADILAQADPDDLDKDGISGKANRVWNPVTQQMALGRFGWKAGTPSVLVQTAGAYNHDMGITNPLLPTESSQGQFDNMPQSSEPELSQAELDDVTYYARTLAVPAARNFSDAEVQRGRQLFEKLNCASCHTPQYTTGALEGLSELSYQTIFPYTDMLLHDMGPELADNRPEFAADGNEWKTRPLWGIGLTEVVNGHSNFLHDGRARNLTEAILWHGGEAEKSRDAFRKLSATERKALIQFLRAL